MPKKQLKYFLILLLLIFIGLAEAGLIWHKASEKTNTQASKSSSTITKSATGFNKQQYSINNVTSLWVVVNKGRVLPSTYVPAGLVVPNVPLRLGGLSPEMHLRSDAAVALQTMFASAKSSGLELMLASGYRSYANQVTTYNGFVNANGIANADTFSARPGHSEHQTGLAADVESASHVCELQPCFGQTPEGKWLVRNAYKFGFIIRYQPGKQSLTGYEAEPWHIRYVGKALAAQIQRSGLTLEQFFGLTAYASYPTSMYYLK